MKTTCFALVLLFAAVSGAAAAPPAGPPADFAIETDYTVKSPDGAAAFTAALYALSSHAAYLST